MNVYKLPTGWADFSSTALDGLLSTVNAMAERVDIDFEGDDETASGVDQLDALADARDEVQAQIDQRDAEQAAADERREAVKARFAKSEEEPEEEPDEEDDKDEAEAAVEDVVETAVEEAEELSADDEVETEIVEEEAKAELSAKPDKNPAKVARAMAQRRTESETPQVSIFGNTVPMVATSNAAQVGFSEDEELDIVKAAEAIANFSHRTKSHRGERSFAPVVTSLWDFEDAVLLSEGDVQRNFGVFQNVRDLYTGEQETLVASGGPCAPLQSTYNFFSIFSPQRPIEAFLPTIGAPRGGIKYLNPVALSEGDAAITTQDAAQGALLPEDVGYADKNCSRVSCPTESSITVAAVAWCVTFDNLNFRVFPEQVQDFLRRVQTAHTKAKEIYYLDRIDALAVTPIDLSTDEPRFYGAVRSLHRELATAAHRYRKAHNMSRDAVLDVLLPDVAIEILQIDMTNDHAMGMSFLNAPQSAIVATLAQKLRLNVGFYYYDATPGGGFPASAHNGDSSAWRPLPTIFRSYMWAPGSIVRLDAGVLDLGVVRDSTLNKSNDVELFAEQFVEIAHVGAEVVAHDHTIIPSGQAAPEPAAAWAG